MTSTELQTMPYGLHAKSMAVLAELNAFLHLIVAVLPPWPSEGCASDLLPGAAKPFGKSINEAPVAIRDAPVDRSVLLLIVLIAGITPPLGA